MILNAIDIAEDILLNATDYIGNDPTRFCADNYALNTMRNNEQFRNSIKKAITDCPEEYVHMQGNQEESAKFVWQMYKRWTYGS